MHKKWHWLKRSWWFLAWGIYAETWLSGRSPCWASNFVVPTSLRWSRQIYHIYIYTQYQSKYDVLSSKQVLFRLRLALRIFTKLPSTAVSLMWWRETFWSTEQQPKTAFWECLTFRMQENREGTPTIRLKRILVAVHCMVWAGNCLDSTQNRSW